MDNTAQPASPMSNPSSSSTLLDFGLLFVTNKKLVIGFPILVGLLALIVALLLPSWYTATAKIMPPQQSQSNAVAILGQIGALAGAAGGASSALGLRNPSDIYVTMLKSRTIADNIIDRFELKAVYGEESSYWARKKLARNTSISASRDGVITLEVDDKNAQRAAEIANAFIEELKDLTLKLAVTEASQRRLFFEAQLKRAKTDLTSAEVELRKYTTATGLVNPQGQIGLSVAAAASLRANIAAKEIQMAAMRTFATESNPDLQRTAEEIAALRSELAKMERDPSAGRGDVTVAIGKAPTVGLEYIRRYRDMKYFETLFEVLAKQYEIARIDEAKDATLIQVLDKAVQPDRRSRPIRWLIVVLSAVTAFGIALAFLIASAAMRNVSSDPQKARKMAELRRSLFRVS